MAFNHHLSPHTEQSKSQDQDHVLVIVHNSGDAPEVASLEAMQPNSAAFCRSSNSTQASFFECAKDTGLSPLEADSPTMTAKETILQRSIPACKSSTKKLNLHEHTTYSHQSDDIAAEVSIARQISISCRQRQLITQIVPKIAQQPMQPKLVGNSALRKSHHLNLEDA